MFSPIYHSPEYNDWFRKMISDSRDTIARTNDLCADVDKLLIALRMREKRMAASQASATTTR